ncbi:homeodomain-interacting protein kinase 2-like isoform 1-T1 [Synchiropus picturatus]
MARRPIHFFFPIVAFERRRFTMRRLCPSLSRPGDQLSALCPLPAKYKILKVIGEGGYGMVVKCLDKGSKEVVAIKVGADQACMANEAMVLNMLMESRLDTSNIVKFYGAFNDNKYMVFEKLDINLQQHLFKRKGPVSLQEVRTIIQQLASGLSTLKEVGVIHTDVKPNNIMLVDRKKEPLKVKLIDFGLAVVTSQAEAKHITQVLYYRCPEVIFGLPCSEAIDMWSLGCVMARMILGCELFPGCSDHELLRYMYDILGPPPDQVMHVGKKTTKYCNRTTDHWFLKTIEDYFGKEDEVTEKRQYSFRSLDELKSLYKKEHIKAEAEEWHACVDLLMAMLNWDDEERISPAEVLIHPFITMNYGDMSQGGSSTFSALRQLRGKKKKARKILFITAPVKTFSITAAVRERRRKRQT